MAGLMLSVEVGLRVVRGPDWMWRDQDGGEGHVGTVLAVGTGENNIPTQTAVVQWDSGFYANYRVGYQGAYDLRVFDSGPTGVKHSKDICSVCKRTDIPGSRWTLDNCTLCQQCYMADQQDVHKSFLISSPFAHTVNVPVRSASRKVESLGIFSGATVTRGHHWRWGNQDGGEGMQGTVQKLEDCDCGSSSSVVIVTWATGRTNVYRLGHHGKVDLKCVEETSGGSYYPDHLPVLGAAAVSHDSDQMTCTPGDHVKDHVDIDPLKEVQEDHITCHPSKGQEADTAATASLTLKHENDTSDKSVVEDSTSSSPGQLTGQTHRFAMTVAERLAEAQLTALGTESTSADTTDLSDVQPNGMDATTTHKESVGITSTDLVAEVEVTVGQSQSSGAGATPKGFAMKWPAKSGRHKSKLYKLHNLEKKDLVDLPQFHMSADPDYIIGKGNYAVVFLGFIKNDWREIAIKRMQNVHSGTTTNEVKILLELNHQNIVPYRMVDDDKDFTYIASDLCDYTLREWIELKQLHPLREWDAMAASLTKDLLCGLDYLHTRKEKILHRDIKPENMFIVDANEWHLKLGDFGISRSLDEDRSTMCTGPAGTKCWKAKEVVMCENGQQLHYKPSTDIQPAGMVTFFILTKGKHPYCLNGKVFEIESNIGHDKFDLSAVSDLVTNDMLTSMLAGEPTKRPSAAQLLSHPFFWNGEKRFQFLATIGNQAEIANSQNDQHSNCHVRNLLESSTDIIPHRDWTPVADKLKKLSNRFQRNFRKKDYVESICKLLRTMRNIQDHFDNESGEAQTDLGGTCYPFRFFDQKLPFLFIRTYTIIADTAGKPDDWTKRDQLKIYFSPPAM